MKKFLVKTLGCKANFSDGQSLEAGLIRRGLMPASGSDDADVVIVNSCTVTDEADQQSRKMARDLIRKNPKLKVIYTGCGAEVDPGSALKISGLSAVVGNQNKFEAADLIADHLSLNPSGSVVLGGVRAYGELLSKHPMDREWPLPSEGAIESPVLPKEASTFRTRAFLKVQEGCDSFCTYCIIPYGRGPARSLEIKPLIERIHVLVSQGVKEVVLTGTNIGDYGVDWSGRLQIDDLIEAILTKTKLPRLRVGSLDPTEISERMIDLVEDYESFCPHFHVSLQHTESKILKLMKRKYSRAEIEEVFGRLSRMKRIPFVGMDVITGFPGESDQDFSLMKESLSQLSWNRLHVFPYSEREGTPATRLKEKVTQNVRKARARELQEMSLERLTRTHSGKREATLSGVLLEGSVRGPDGNRSWISGYSKDYQRVLLPLSNSSLDEFRNQVISVKVSRWVVDRASGEVSWLGELHHG